MFTHDLVYKVFEGDKHIYFVTIKPPPSKVDEIYRIIEYIEKRVENYWIVKCQSIKGYVHYHGLVSFKESQTIDNKTVRAVHRQINRVMGFLKIDPMNTSLSSVCAYIRANNNTNNKTYTQEDFSNKSIIDLNNI